MSQDVDSDLVRKLAGLLEETGLGELEYATADWRIKLARPAPAPIAAAAAVAPAPTPAPTDPGDSGTPAADSSDDPNVLRAPMVGTAYLGPDPQSPPFAPVGTQVGEGDTVMIVEAMKVMNAIPAHRAGTIKKVLVDSGQPVEFGQAMMVIE